MTSSAPSGSVPMILAPAGSRSSLLAAVAAGADAVYCGFKAFSARMEAKNFDLGELARLVAFAHERGVRVHLAFNTLILPGEVDAALQVLDALVRTGPPDALIYQDPSVPLLARRAGYSGELHLSTLAAATAPSALLAARRLGADQVVVPRELSIDEIRAMASACPEGLGLEVFIHGALCYAVSGRCYWSSYLGGKSGLRGRCVQPCRRIFQQKGSRGRLFSCTDLGLDVLVKVLKTVPQVRTWKIEGRKKGPHYVYYTVTAYRMLRDEGGDPAAKKAALELLSRSLGRSATHYRFLPQRPFNPVGANETGSGMLIGRTKGAASSPFLNPSEELLPGDVLRIGYEDSREHRILRLRQAIPAGGRYQLPQGPRQRLPRGTPVFLVDRREPALGRRIRELEAALEALALPAVPRSSMRLPAAEKPAPSGRGAALTIRRLPGRGRADGEQGLWLSDVALERAVRRGPRLWWALPPVVWPDEEKNLLDRVERALKAGARRFVLNQPWQIAYFEGRRHLELWAGPFCNAANPPAVEALAAMGFTGVVASPELDREALAALPRRSRIPMGVVIHGNWPLCLSRVLAEPVAPAEPFSSPMGEQAWVRRHDGTYWVYPNWCLDLQGERGLLERAGYRLFLHLAEPAPKGVRMKPRPGKWNWDIGLR